jgi:hypothetical protein
MTTKGNGDDNGKCEESIAVTRRSWRETKRDPSSHAPQDDCWKSTATTANSKGKNEGNDNG